MKILPTAACLTVFPVAALAQQPPAQSLLQANAASRNGSFWSPTLVLGSDQYEGGRGAGDGRKGLFPRRRTVRDDGVRPDDGGEQESGTLARSRSEWPASSRNSPMNFRGRTLAWRVFLDRIRRVEP